jgi:hypothetical protein
MLKNKIKPKAKKGNKLSVKPEEILIRLSIKLDKAHRLTKYREFGEMVKVTQEFHVSHAM